VRLSKRLKVIFLLLLLTVAAIAKAKVGLDEWTQAIDKDPSRHLQYNHLNRYFSETNLDVLQCEGMEDVQVY